MIREAIEKDDFEGIYHAASLQPVTNAELRAALHIPFGISTPGFIAKLGAFLVGTEPQLILLGRRAISERLAERQFVFQYPGCRKHWHTCLTILKTKPARRQ